MYSSKKKFEFSLAGKKLTGPSGILELMDDLGQLKTFFTP